MLPDTFTDRDWGKESKDGCAVAFKGSLKYKLYTMTSVIEGKNNNTQHYAPCHN